MPSRFTKAAAAISVAAAATAFAVIFTTAAPASTRSDDPKVDVAVNIDQITLTDESKPGDTYTTYLKVHDNIGNTDTEGSGQCALVPKAAGPLVSRCLTILQLKDGEITINGTFTRVFPVTYKGAVLGGTGAYKDIHGEADMTRPDPKTISIKINS